MSARGISSPYQRYMDNALGKNLTGRYSKFIKYLSVLVFLVFGDNVTVFARDLRSNNSFQQFSWGSTAPLKVQAAPEVVTVPPAVKGDYPVIQGGDDPDRSVQEKRNKVKKMMQHAWNGYERWAFGSNELRPLTQQPFSGILGDAPLGATIIDSLDSLYIMGLEEEYKKGREWVTQNFKIDDLDVTLSVFETNIRLIGGLISCYALTGDTLLRDKAEQIAKKLLPAFRTPTGIPNGLVNFKTGASENYNYAGGSSILSELGTFHLEFAYLSDITGNSTYRAKVETVRKVLQRLDKPQGLYPNYLNPKNGHWGRFQVSIGALGDSFYEYLLKAWLQSDREDSEAKTMFTDAMDAIIRKLLQKSQGGLMYFATLNNGHLDQKMEHLACFAGGLLGLAARTLNDNHTQRYMGIAEGITNTCHESYDRSKTKLGPESFGFYGGMEAAAITPFYILRPEVVESYFIMWRLTKKQKYREWAWEAVQALEKYCLAPDGYSGIDNVNLKVPIQDDIQQSFFLAETLKYLYLIFSDDSLISLDKWVFNTEAHPLPIKNTNPFYRARSTNRL